MEGHTGLYQIESAIEVSFIHVMEDGNVLSMHLLVCAQDDDEEADIVLDIVS